MQQTNAEVFFLLICLSLPQVVAGISATTFNSNPAYVLGFKESVAQVIPGTTSNNVLGVSASSPRQRYLLASSTATSVSFTLAGINANRFGNSSSAYSNLGNQLSAAVSSGNFTAALRQQARYIPGAAGLANISVAGLQLLGIVPNPTAAPTAIPTTLAPTPSSTLLTAAGIATVAGTMAFLACLIVGILYYFFHYKREEEGDAEDNFGVVDVDTIDTGALVYFEHSDVHGHGHGHGMGTDAKLGVDMGGIFANFYPPIHPISGEDGGEGFPPPGGEQELYGKREQNEENSGLIAVHDSEDHHVYL